ncbi:MAG: UbiA family prenyltransferase [Anaerolineaceae bacterium]
MTGAVSSRNPALSLLIGMRPYQWPKNGIVFAAFVFSAGDAWRVTDASSWGPLLWRTCAIFGLWCLVSSSIYLLNDILDRDLDRMHPRKRLRPIAAGQLSPRVAATASFLLVAVATPLAFWLDVTGGAVLTGYAVVMIAYSSGLKAVPVLDIIILCTGVVARAVGGAAAIDVQISPWLYVCSSFAALFFAVSKRWAEHRQLGSEAALHRPSLANYPGELLSQLLTISAATALVSYALYTIESRNVPEDGRMAVTIPFVAFALFRYLYLLNGRRSTDAPDQIMFTDPQIILAVVAFVTVSAGVLVSR